MQTLTLCESSIRALSSQSPGPKRPPESPLSPSPSSRRNLLPFQLNSSRSARQRPRYLNACHQLLKHFERAHPVHKHGDIQMTPEATGPLDGGHSSGSRKNGTILRSEIYDGLKFALLCGMLAFQGSPQAVADTEFTSGVQSMSYLGDLGDISTGFASAFLLIFFSELGDKTFFIAALLAARNSGAVIFIGTFGALAAMTFVSVVIGRTFHYVDGILPFRSGETDLPIDDIAAVCLLVYFGISTLIEAASGDDLKMKEEQKEAELAISELRGNGAGILAAANTVISTFLLVFVAEWGDKSFFSTIALAAASSPLGVVGGALVGHAVATLLAVVGGSLLGTFLSEKVIAYVGGVLFLVFAMATLVEIVS